MTMHEYLSAVLKEKGWTKMKLAEECGIGNSDVGKMLNGRARISAVRGQKMCEALGLEYNEVAAMCEPDDDIITEEKPKQPKKPKPEPEPVEEKPKAEAQPEDVPFGITEREAGDPVELFINMMHLFVCELNDNGKRATMAMMRMIRQTEVFGKK